MTEVCPISEKQINERIARLSASISFILVAIFLVTLFKPILVFLIIDYIIRGFFDAKYSPIRIAGQFISNSIGIHPRYINAGPKIFAAKIGVVLSTAILLSFHFEFMILGYVIAGILIFFSFLEGIFGFCVACKIYPFLFNKRS